MCKHCGFQEVKNFEHKSLCPHCLKELNVAGPMYRGELQNPKWLKNILEVLNEDVVEDKEVKLLLEKILEDSLVKNSSLLSYDTHYLCKLRGSELKSIQDYVAFLKEHGFEVSRSCFPITGLKTSASFEVLQELFPIRNKDERVLAEKKRNETNKK